MDALVEAALRKWPQVPHCHGWLALDARGDWFMRDDACQAAGPFPQVKGSRITHEKLREFIHRNYLHDEQGAWYFQNGPQRVYVQLEAAPYIWRLQAHPGAQPQLTAHTGHPAWPTSAWLDEHGRLFLSANCQEEAALGLVHTLDMHLAAEAVEQGWWQVQDTTHADVLAQHGVRLMASAP